MDSPSSFTVTCNAGMPDKRTIAKNSWNNHSQIGTTACLIATWTTDKGEDLCNSSKVRIRSTLHNQSFVSDMLWPLTHLSTGQ
jgi:hypothetical protein